MNTQKITNIGEEWLENKGWYDTSGQDMNANILAPCRRKHWVNRVVALEEKYSVIANFGRNSNARAAVYWLRARTSKDRVRASARTVPRLAKVKDPDESVLRVIEWWKRQLHLKHASRTWIFLIVWYQVDNALANGCWHPGREKIDPYFLVGLLIDPQRKRDYHIK